jgi:hypothetical protein
MLLVAQAGRADLNLNKLECVNPHVVLTTERGFPLTQEELLEALLAKVKTRLPHLRVDSACANGLYFRVVVAKTATEGGRPLGYFGGVRLELLRAAIILDTMARTELTAWQAGSALSGPPGDEKTALLNSLDGLIGNFADAYHRAGNP